jgi:hypothetical protein
MVANTIRNSKTISLILLPINFINEKLTFLHSREIFKAILFDQLGIQSMMGRNFIYFSGTLLIARILELQR